MEEPELRSIREIRDYARDIVQEMDSDLLASGSPSKMFGPYQLLLRQIIEAGAQFARIHPEAVDKDVAEALSGIISNGQLDAEPAAAVPQPVEVYSKFTGLTVEEIRAILDGTPGGQVEALIQERTKGRISYITDVMDSVWKAALGAPASYGSRFGKNKEE